MITWSDAVAGKRLFVSESLALVSTEEVDRAGEPTKSRLFALRMAVSVFDTTQPDAISFELPLHFNYRELRR